MAETGWEKRRRTDQPLEVRASADGEMVGSSAACIDVNGVAAQGPCSYNIVVDRSGQRIQAALGVHGAVATAAGAQGVLRGPSEVRAVELVSAAIDSEYRFYAAWYSVGGVVLLRAARSPEQSRFAVHAAAGGFFLAAVGRALSWRKLGPPTVAQKALMAAEFLIPVVLVPWWHATTHSEPVRRNGATQRPGQAMPV